MFLEERPSCDSYYTSALQQADTCYLKGCSAVNEKKTSIFEANLP